MQFGASIWPFQWNPPYEDGIRRLSRLGFKNVELIAWDGDALKEYYTPEKIRALKSVMAGEGMTLSEFVSSPPGAAEADPARRRGAVEHFKRATEVAKALGTSMINSVVATPFGLAMPRMLEMPQTQQLSVDLPKGANWAEAYRWYVDTCRDCARICEAAEMRWALETHPHRWASNAIAQLRLFEQIGSPAVGANFDPSHLFPCGDLPQVAVYELADRIFHCHFSDNDGTTNAHWRPGKGKIDWAQVLLALKDVGFDGVISIELEDVPGRANRQRPTADSVFDVENTESRRYIADLAATHGINLA
jgi:sugar phosphate isomerase/epimerase